MDRDADALNGISTHAPLAGRDPIDGLEELVMLISTHAPLAGRDAGTAQECRELAAFQPTRPLRGATGCCPTSGRSFVFQPTRPLRGATVYDLFVEDFFEISTHAPLAGRDLSVTISNGLTMRNFNPRAPCGARPVNNKTGAVTVHISTHAPLAGRDIYHVRGCPVLPDFNPRAPCGARLSSFLPCFVNHFISTHAPLAGRDLDKVMRK